MTKNLLIGAPYFPPEGGGLEVYVQEIARRLGAAHRWRVAVVTSGPQGQGLVREEWSGVPVYRLPCGVTLSRTRVNPLWIRQIQEIIADERPDVVNIHMPVPGIADAVAVASRSLPLVVTYHGGSMRKGRRAIDATIRVYERLFGRRLLARADRIISTSASTRDSICLPFRAKCTIITPGIDPSRFVPAASRVEAAALFVGGAGRGWEHKGADAAVRAFARVASTRPEASLTMVGPGDFTGTRKLARDLGVADKVHILGRVGGDEIADCYRRASVLVLPTSNDSFGMVILEAMASGIPAIASNIGDIPSLIHDGETGFVIDPADDDAMAHALARVLDDPDLARRMGARGREVATVRHCWDHQAALTDRVLSSVLSEGPVNEKTRLAVAVPYFKPKAGGMERYSREIVAGLHNSGRYEVVVITTKAGSRRTSYDVTNGFTVISLPNWFRLSNTPVSPIWKWQIRRILRDNRIQVVNGHAPVPGLADAAQRSSGTRPFVLTYHANSMVKGHAWQDPIIRVYEALALPRLLRGADAAVAVSPSVKTFLRTRGAENIVVASPATDTDLFSPGTTTDGRTLLYVGRIESASAWKGIDVLLSAMPQVLLAVSDARLVVIGDGDAIPKYVARAQGLGIGERVEFVGYKAGEQLAAAYRSSAVVVLPSTSAAESFGMVLIEAMACGRPVVGSRIGGIPYVISDGEDGLLVAPGNAAALAGACIRLLEDPDLANEFGRRGREKAQAGFTWPERIQAYDDLITGMVKHNARPPQHRTATSAASIPQPQRNSERPEKGDL